jgi:pantothenate kinase type III
MKIEPINCGYYQYKGLENNIFNSRLSKSVYDSIPGNCDVIEVNGEKYTIGVGKVNIDMDKTNNEFTKIFVLNMLGRFTGDKEIFKVVLSSPPLVYSRHKEVLPEYLEGRYEVIHNGRKKEITIEAVKVYPETIAAYLANRDKFKGKNVIVIDIGGLTTNAVLIRNGMFTGDDIITIKHGMYHLDFKISQYLLSINLESGFNCEPEDVQYFRDTKDEILEDEKVIDIYREFIDDILEKMDNKNWNYNKFEILITGGGGKNLFDYIKGFSLPKSVLSNDPVYDNLKGLEILGRQVFSK